MTNVTRIPQSKMDQLLGYVVNENPDDVRELLRRNGFSNADSLQGSELSNQFLKQIKDSSAFRTSVSDYLTGMVQHETSSGKMNFISTRTKNNFTKGKSKSNFNFVDSNSDGYDDQTGFYFTDFDGDGYDDYDGTYVGFGPKASVNPSPSPTPPAASSSGSFWSSLGSSSNINSILNTGLNVLSTTLINKSNSSSEQKALQAKSLDLQIAQTNAAAKAQAAQDSHGMPAWGWVLIVLAAIGAVTTIVIVRNRKKSKAVA